MRNQFQYDLQGGEGLGPPVDGNEGKEPILDLVPFAGSWRIMRDGDRQLLFIGQVLQLFLPESVFDAVGTASISGDEQFALFWIENGPHFVPPSPDALHRELGGLMVNAHIHKASVVDQVVDSIRDRFAISQREKVIHIHLRVLSFGLPFSPVVLKMAKQFLLLAVNRDDGSTSLFKRKEVKAWTQRCPFNGVL